MESLTGNDTSQLVDDELVEPPLPSTIVTVLNTTEEAAAIGVSAGDGSPAKAILTTYQGIAIDWRGVCRDDPYIMWINSTTDDPALNTEVLCKLYAEKLNPTAEDIKKFVAELQENAKNAISTLNGTDTLESLMAESNVTTIEDDTSSLVVVSRVRRDASDVDTELGGDNEEDADAAPVLLVNSIAAAPMMNAEGNGTVVNVTLTNVTVSRVRRDASDADTDLGGDNEEDAEAAPVLLVNSIAAAPMMNAEGNDTVVNVTLTNVTEDDTSSLVVVARVRRDASDAGTDLGGANEEDAEAAPVLLVNSIAAAPMMNAEGNGTVVNVTLTNVTEGITASNDVNDPTLVVNWELAALLRLNLSSSTDNRDRSRQVGFKLKDVCHDVTPPELEQSGGEGVGAGSLGDLGLDADEYSKTLKNDTAVDDIKETLKGNQSSLGGSYIEPILKQRQYDPFSPPKFFKGQSIEIKIGMYIESMSNFETTTMDYDMDLYLQMAWRDPRLSSNLSLPILIKEEDLRDKIWRPDPYFSNSKEADFHEVTFLNFLMKIFPTGEVYYEIRIKLKPACNLILCKYPHDKQVCYLRVESFAYPQEEVRFLWFTNSEDALNKNSKVRLPELYIDTYEPQTCVGHRQTGNYSCLHAVFKLGRDIGYHVSQTYIPTSLALMFSWVGVFLPDEFMEGRIALAITVLLTMSTESAGAREHLPSVSYLKAIDLWFGFITAFVFCTLLQTLIVISLDKRSNQLSKWASKKRSGVSEAMCEKMMRRSEWLHKAAAKLDNFCRIFYPLLFVIFLIVYFFVFTKGRQDSCISERG